MVGELEHRISGLHASDSNLQFGLNTKPTPGVKSKPLNSLPKPPAEVEDSRRRFGIGIGTTPLQCATGWQAQGLQVGVRRPEIIAILPPKTFNGLLRNKHNNRTLIPEGRPAVRTRAVTGTEWSTALPPEPAPSPRMQSPRHCRVETPAACAHAVRNTASQHGSAIEVLQDEEQAQRATMMSSMECKRNRGTSWALAGGDKGTE